MKNRRSPSTLAVGAFFETLSTAFRYTSRARKGFSKVSIHRDVPYLETGKRDHLLDIYVPKRGEGPRPVVLYLHGGGFSLLSKDTHWSMALRLASQNCIVVVPNYSLSPRHRFPAGLMDCAKALTWTLSNIDQYGGDSSRLLLAGESAGANLVTSLTLCMTQEREETFASELFALSHVPRAVVAMYGILQVSDPERFTRQNMISSLAQSRITSVAKDYLPSTDINLELANPLLVLESDRPTVRPLPPFFASVGTKDPLLDDSQRLHHALSNRGVCCEYREYEGEPHAFNTLPWSKLANQSWQDLYSFIHGVV